MSTWFAATTRWRLLTARSWCVYFCAILLICACDVTHRYLNTFTTADREIAVRVYMCNMTYLCVWHDSLIRQHAHDCWPRDRGAYIYVKREVKLQVSLAEYGLFYRALLQKRTIISSILLTEATPYSLWRVFAQWLSPYLFSLISLYPVNESLMSLYSVNESLMSVYLWVFAHWMSL